MQSNATHNIVLSLVVYRAFHRHVRVHDAVTDEIIWRGKWVSGDYRIAVAREFARDSSKFGENDLGVIKISWLTH